LLQTGSGRAWLQMERSGNNLLKKARVHTESMTLMMMILKLKQLLVTVHVKSLRIKASSEFNLGNGEAETGAGPALSLFCLTQSS
jgi:hypothetical protein